MKNFANYIRAEAVTKLIVISLVFAMSTSSLVAAAPSTTSSSNTNSSGNPAISCTKTQCDLVAKYIQPTVNILAAVFGTAAAISMIAGGIQYTTSEGDPQKTAAAKKRITNTIIAILAFIFLYSFLQFLVPGGIFNRATSG